MYWVDVFEVVNVCDVGCEGEFIFCFVYEMVGCKKFMCCFWIFFMEDSVIKEGFFCLKNGEEYDVFFVFVLCRVKVDWLIGINVICFFFVFYNYILNVGCVQILILKMFVDWDVVIIIFKKEKYYYVCFVLFGVEVVSEKLFDCFEVDRLKVVCEMLKVVCIFFVKEKKIVVLLKFFDFIFLQREVNCLFGYIVKQIFDFV